jgi:archaellum component FlaC
MDEEQFNRFMEMFQTMFDKFGMSDFKSSVDHSNKSLSQQEKLTLAVNKKFAQLNKDIEKSSKGFKNFEYNINSLDEQIEEMDEGIDKLTAEINRNRLAGQYLTQQYLAAGKQLSKAIGDVLVKGAIQGTKTLVNGLQNGTSGVQLAAELMTNAIDVGQSGFSALAVGGQAAGAAMTTAGGKVGRFGGLVTGASLALDYFTKTSSELAKFGIEVLAKEVEKTVKAFNDSVAAGAVFSKGMDDLRFYSSRAGLTVDQFSNVIKNNSGLLAESGYTVSEASKIVSNITSRFAVQTGKSGQTLQREMLNLGYGFQEQAEISAQVVASMKRTGTGQQSRGEIAAATADLAKDMRKVADIMGEEAKAKQDAAKKATEQYAFYEMLVKRAKETNDPTLVDRVRLAFEKMSESEVRARIQFAVSGGAVSDFTANITGAAEGAGDFNNAVFNEVNPSLERLGKSSDELHDRYVQGGNEMYTALSRAGIMVGAHGETVAELNAIQQLAFKANTGTSEKARQAANSLAGAQGGLQDGVIGAEIAAQNLRLALQDELTPAIVNFAKVTKEILKDLKETLAKMGFKQGTEQEPGMIDKLRESKAISRSLYTTGIGLEIAGLAADSTLVGAAAGIPMNILGIGAGALGFGADLLGFADGGIVHQPEIAMIGEGGNSEAVVPLPDNRSIPVTMKGDSKLDTKEITSAIRQQSGVLNQILVVMKENNQLTSGILQTSY